MRPLHRPLLRGGPCGGSGHQEHQEGGGDLRELRPHLLPQRQGGQAAAAGEAVLVQVRMRGLHRELAHHARHDPGCAQLQVIVTIPPSVPHCLYYPGARCQSAASPPPSTPAATCRPCAAAAGRTSTCSRSVIILLQ